MRTPEGKRVLKRLGSDEPCCPQCSGGNAMLYDQRDEDGSAILKCRDCGLTVREADAFIWQAEYKKNSKTGEGYYKFDRSLPWQHDCTVCGKRLVNDDGSFLTKGRSIVPYSETAVLTSDQMLTCSKCYHADEED